MGKDSTAQDNSPATQDTSLAVQDNSFYNWILTTTKNSIDQRWTDMLREHALEMGKIKVPESAKYYEQAQLEKLFTQEYLKSLRAGYELSMLSELSSGIGQAILMKLWSVYVDGTWRGVAPDDLQEFEWTLTDYAKMFISVKSEEYRSDIARIVERVLVFVTANSSKILPVEYHKSPAEWVVEQYGMRDLKMMSQYMVHKPTPERFCEVLQNGRKIGIVAALRQAIKEDGDGVETIQYQIINHADGTTTCVFPHMSLEQYKLLVKRLKKDAEGMCVDEKYFKRGLEGTDTGTALESAARA